jgi:hypothetical protein
MHSAALAAQLGRPAQRASARWHCPAACGSAAALLSVSAAARHRCTGDGGETVAHRRGDGGVARRRRASDARRRRTGRWRLRTAAVGTAARVRRAVGRRAAQARRRSGASGARRLSGTARARRGSCWDARRAVPTVALNHGVSAAADRWGPLSAISE